MSTVLAATGAFYGKTGHSFVTVSVLSLCLFKTCKKNAGKLNNEYECSKY